MKNSFKCIVVLLFTLLVSGCTTNQVSTGEYSFVDDMGRQVVIDSPKNVAVASGSYSALWQLAGGRLHATTEDSFSSGLIDTSSNIIDLGAIHSPSLETIIASKVDFMILMPDLSGHQSLAKSLDSAGIAYAFIDVENFDDYVNTLRIFCDITGRDDLYDIHGTQLSNTITSLVNTSSIEGNPTYLLLRASSSKVSARDSDTSTASMLNQLGAVNVTDEFNSLLDTLSLEKIIEINPDYIFVICMGEQSEAKAQMEYLFSSNPAWNSLDAVKNDQFYYLEKELFHNKPNERWNESYEILINILQATNTK